MKLVKIIKIPQAEIEFTEGEVHRMIDLALAHYDATCRLSAVRGGFLYGIAIHFAFPNAEKSTSVLLAFREVDLLVKITESLRRANEGEEDLRLHYALRAVLLQMNKATELPS